MSYHHFREFFLDFRPTLVSVDFREASVLSGWVNRSSSLCEGRAVLLREASEYSGRCGA